jgi:hypothetical protein
MKIAKEKETVELEQIEKELEELEEGDEPFDHNLNLART